MTERDYRGLLWGVGLLAASLLLVELLAFRLAAATLGYGFAMIVGLGQPSALALGALWLGRRGASASPHEVCASAGHYAALAGAFTVAGAISLTWVSQKYALERGELWHFVLALASFLLPFAFAGAALGLALRRGAGVIGRLGFAEGLGAAIGCALIPAAMWAGTPRAMLAAGILFAASAFAFASAGRTAEPRWPVIATLPLAVLALILGDVGEQWMEVRTDDGRRTSVRHWVWTEQGVVALAKIERGESRLQIDRNDPVLFAKKRASTQKPRFEAVDLGYLVPEREPEQGPALVIGSGGAREVDVALAYDHPRVDVIELHRALFEAHGLEAYAAMTGHVLADGERLRLRVGDGRLALRELGTRYQRIVVLAGARFDQAAPRLLSRHDRLFTTEAVQAYLRLLRGDGTLLLRVPLEGIYAAIAAAAEALEGPSEAAGEHLVACAGGDEAVLVVVPGALRPNDRAEMVKRCRKSRLEVVLPLEEPRRGRRDFEASRADYDAQQARVAGARAAHDDRPFLVAPPEPAGLWAATATTARALAARDASEAPSGEDGEEVVAAEVVPVGLAALGAIAALGTLVLGFLAPLPRGKPRPAFSLRASFLFLGAALALCMFALSDRLLRVSGDAAFAWSFVIPLGLVGIASGRLWVDTLARGRARRGVMLALAIALVWLLLLHVVGERLEGLASRPEAVRLGLSGALLLISGFLLGFPLSAGLRFVGEWDRVPVAWSFGMHHAGWALGGAAAALLVHYVGVARLWPLGLAAFAVGAVLLTLGAREAPPAKLVLKPRR